MEFAAQKPDLVLELTTLSGEKETLEPKKIMNGAFAKEIMDKWGQLEKAQNENKLGPIDIITTELSYVYPKTQEWFEENFDVNTLQDILVYVAQIVGGAKKKRTSSKQS